MSKNIPEKQDNDKLRLRFDRVDQLKKQIGDIAALIEMTKSFSYIEYLRNTVISGLSTMTDPQRKKINVIFNEAGIFDLIRGKHEELRKQAVVSRNTAKEAVSKRPDHRNPRGKRNGFRHPHGKPDLKLVEEPKEIEAVDSTYNPPETYCYKGVEIDVVKRTSAKGKEIIQVTDIRNGELPKIKVGNTYSPDALPTSLKFAMFPEERAKYEAEQAAKEEARLKYRREQGALHNKAAQHRRNSGQKAA